MLKYLCWMLFLIAVSVLVFSCVSPPREPEKVLCVNPCSMGVITYTESVAGFNTFRLKVEMGGLSVTDKLVAMQVFDLRKDFLAKKMKYSFCYTASVEFDDIYELSVGFSSMDLIIVKGVIICQD